MRIEINSAFMEIDQRSVPGMENKIQPIADYVI